jgi:hypothetical protein
MEPVSLIPFAPVSTHPELLGSTLLRSVFVPFCQRTACVALVVLLYVDWPTT